MQSGPRAGERVLEQTIQKVIEKGIVFTQMRADKAFCAPARESIFTGLLCNNHGITNNETANYYPYCRQGQRINRINGPGTWNATHWHGPWELDLALMAANAMSAGSIKDDLLAQLSVPPASQPLGARLNNRRNPIAARGDSTIDDLQAFTGSLPTWLKQAGVTCGLIGKYQNAFAAQDTTTGENGIGYYNDRTLADLHATYQTAFNASNAGTRGMDIITALAERYVPPGWDFWRSAVGTLLSYGGGSQDHWNVRVSHFDGDNPADGWGKECDSIVSNSYQRLVAGNVSRPNTSSLVATVVSASHGMVAGDEFCMDGATQYAWNSIDWTVDTVVNDNTFTFLLNSAPLNAELVASGASLAIYPRKSYGERLWAEAALDFIEGRADDEPWFLYYAPDNPHYSQGTGGGEEPSHSSEKRYEGTVGDSEAFRWRGLPGFIPDMTGPMQWGSDFGNTVTCTARRHDGSGPFDISHIGKPVIGAGIPSGTVVTAVASNLPNDTGGTCTISNVPTHASHLATDTPNGADNSPYLTIGSQVTNPYEAYIDAQKDQQFGRRAEMLASVDDTVYTLLTACKARNWTNVTIMLTNDNGWQQGEKQDLESFDMWDAKLTLWEGSIRSILLVLHPPWWAADTECHYPVSHMDMCPTILDFFSESPAQASLASHHAHEKRDGISIVKLFADDTHRDRIQYLHGDTYEVPVSSSRGEGVVNQNALKLIRHIDGTGNVRLFNVQNRRETGYTDYEVTNLNDGSHNAEVADLSARCDAARVARWELDNTGTWRHTLRDA